MRYLPLVLALVSGCAFDLGALHGTGLGDSGVPLGDTAPEDAAVVIGDDASLADVPVVVALDAGSDAPSPWVDQCPSGRAADCCEGAYCTLTGACVRAVGCGSVGGPCCPGFGCVAGLRCVGPGPHAWDNTCEVDPDPPGPTVPPEC